jgi:hypothetical protein
MLLTNEDIEEFRSIWKEEFTEEISPDEATHCASQLLELFSLLSMRLPSAGQPARSEEEPPPWTTSSTAENPAKPKIGKFFRSTLNGMK